VLGEALATGIEVLAGKTLQTKRLTLDGLTSVWHPDAR
jgi:protease IV